MKLRQHEGKMQWEGFTSVKFCFSCSDGVETDFTNRFCFVVYAHNIFFFVLQAPLEGGDKEESKKKKHIQLSFNTDKVDSLSR